MAVPVAKEGLLNDRHCAPGPDHDRPFEPALAVRGPRGIPSVEGCWREQRPGVYARARPATRGECNRDSIAATGAGPRRSSGRSPGRECRRRGTFGRARARRRRLAGFWRGRPRAWRPVRCVGSLWQQDALVVFRSSSRLRDRRARRPDPGEAGQRSARADAMAVGSRTRGSWENCP